VPSQSAIRKLAAILAADVAGYSRLTGADEEGTLARLGELRRELIDPAIAEHRGRIVKTTGDGLLVEFASVVDAVRCALALQRGLAARSVDLLPERRIAFRIGIHLGDVVVEGDDLLGDGVNIAARLEGIAPAGGICLSEAAHQQVQGKIEAAFIDKGPQRLKNIAQPVRAYMLDLGQADAVPRAARRRRSAAALAAAVAVVLAVAAGAGWHFRGGVPPSSAPSPAAPPLSIVVLPFANLSGDPSQEYFADGITEDVTTDLSRIRGSFVIARNTAYTFKGKPVDVKQAAKELGVSYVLEGSVRREGTAVRVAVQLIDGESGQHLWADNFEGERASLFELQNQITGRIANSLRLELTGRQSIRPHAGNLDAQDYVIQARASLVRLQTKDNYKLAQDLFGRAVALDDRLADAWAGLALALAAEEIAFPDAQRAEKLARADDAAAKALTLEPNHAQAHLASALIRMQQRRLAEAAGEVETALALDPNNANAYGLQGGIHAFSGSPERAIASDQQAIRLSPRDPFLAGWQGAISWCYLMLGDDKAAIDWGLRSRSSNPNYAPAHVTLASAYALLGYESAARASLAEARRLNPSLSIGLLRKWAGSDEPAYVKLAERWLDGLRKAGMPEE
jgi:TolB-like protein/class 3 adenylate cyclase